MCKPNYHANFTQEQEDKLRSNMEGIREYMRTFIPKMEEVGLTYISIEFSDGSDSHYDRCDININDRGDVNGRIGGLYIYFDENNKGYKCDTAAWEYKNYAVALMNEWKNVKDKMISKIAAQHAMLKTIEEFEI